MNDFGYGVVSGIHVSGRIVTWERGQSCPHVRNDLSGQDSLRSQGSQEA